VPAAVRVGWERRAGIVGTRAQSNQQYKCSAYTARPSIEAGSITDYPSVLHFSHGIAAEYISERSGNRWVSEYPLS
jgi:hypothetical protein